MHGYSPEKQAYLRRLKRIEGQVRGLQRLIEEDTYCIDVLTQISAVTKALEGVALRLTEDHLRHCVAQAAHGIDTSHESSSHSHDSHESESGTCTVCNSNAIESLDPDRDGSAQHHDETLLDEKLTEAMTAIKRLIR